MAEWAIYYADGSCVTSETSSWENAPADGIVAVVRRDLTVPPRRTVVWGADYYFHVANGAAREIGSTDDIGPQLRLRCPWLKYGAWVSDETYNRILVRAQDDMLW